MISSMASKSIESIAKAAKGYKEAKQKAIFDHEPPKDPRFAPKLKSMSEANDSQPDPEPQDQEPQG